MAAAHPFGFVSVIADEGVPQLEQYLGSLRAAYPHAPALVISDGWDDSGYIEACRRHRVTYRLDRFLKRVECGGRWWRRLFEAGLALETDWVVKIDPDARLWRPFHGVPELPIAGTLEGLGTEYENVQGGCQLIAVDAVKKLLDSGLLEDPILAQHRPFAPSNEIYREWNARAYFCTDKTLLWLARQAGIPWGAWAEVHSLWETASPRNPALRHAVTHPHKLVPDPKFRGAPLHVITTCKGRLAHLKQTLPRWIAEPGVTATVVDYDCPEGTTDWVRESHPEVQVVTARNLPKFCLSHARNLGARYAPEGWWCFWDADCLTEKGWAADVRNGLKHRRYLLARPIQWGQFGSVVVHSHDFHDVGGYDERFRAWGSEDSEFYLRLRQRGYRPGAYDSRRFSAITHSEALRTAYYDVKKVEKSRIFYDKYIERKRNLMICADRLPTPEESDRFLLETVDRYGVDLGLSMPPPLASEVRVCGPGHPTSRAAQEPPVVPVCVSFPTVPSGVTSVPTASTPVPLIAPTVDPRVVRAAVPSPRIVIVNRSSVVSDSQGKALTDVLQIQCDRDFAPHWYTSATLSFVGKNQAAPLNAWWLVLLDDSDQAGALGYHDKTPADNPIGKVFAKSTLEDHALVSVTVSHELLEMLADPFINMTATSQDAKGDTIVWAYEDCDAVEDDRYAYPIEGTPVSDFVFPAFFDQTNPRGPYDFQGHVTKPFEILSGGYLGVFQNGQWSQVTADAAEHHSSTARYKGNRWHRRAAGRSAHTRVSGHAHRMDVGVR